jgi:hypothetical protein
MILSRKHLRVVPNPFAAPLDHDGRPCAVVQYDPEHAARYTLIGVERRERVLEKRAPGSAQQTRVDVTWAYSLEPVTIEDTGYHRALILEGSLLAADEGTAKRAGLKMLAPWADAIRMARAKAIDVWAKAHDGDAPPVGDWMIAGLPVSAPAEKGGAK